MRWRGGATPALQKMLAKVPEKVPIARGVCAADAAYWPCALPPPHGHAKSERTTEMATQRMEKDLSNQIEGRQAVKRRGQAAQAGAAQEPVGG